jgi:hypothetical protein
MFNFVSFARIKTDVPPEIKSTEPRTELKPVFRVPEFFLAKRVFSPLRICVFCQLRNCYMEQKFAKWFLLFRRELNL